jgi:hypothetical protein
VSVDRVAEDGASRRTPSTTLASDLRAARSRLPERVTAILRSRARQDAIASRSYWHPNGFAKLVLFAEAQWGQLRLHVWPDRLVKGDIHGHAWPYESTVLAGELCEVTYDESPSGRRMWRHSYAQVGHRRFLLDDPTPVRLVEVAPAFELLAADASGGNPGHVHCFFAAKAPAVTLVRVGTVSSGFSYVYRPTAEPPHVIAPRPTTRDEVREWIGYLAQVVEG